MTDQRVTAGQPVGHSDRQTDANPKIAPKAHLIKAHPVQRIHRLIMTHPGLLAAVMIYLGLAFSYFFIVPIFEAPDEWTHTGHVKYIAEGNGLPVMWPGRGIWGGQQPPLYYVIGALLVQPFELAAFDGYSERTRNPHASLGYALDPGNKNNYLHSPTENFPYRGLSLTVHVLRLYSMMFGLITIVFSYLTAYELVAHSAYRRTSVGTKEIAHKRRNAALFAGAVALFIACQPMFSFITASVANEPANMAFSTLTLWLAQRYALYGPSRRVWRAMGLGLALGLVALSKMTGMSVGLVAVIAILMAALSSRRQAGAARRLWRDGLIIGGLVLLVAGWWYWRNYRLYGDFFQQGLYKIYFNVDPQPLTLSDFLYTLSTGEVSFWATFGWLNIVGPDWVYSFYRIVSRVGLVGVGLAVLFQLIRAGFRRWSSSRVKASKSADALVGDFAGIWFSPALILHLIFPVALAFSLTRLVAIEGGMQGRQLLPALGSLAIVIVWGWWVLGGLRLRLPTLGLLLALMLGLALWFPYGPVARAYNPQPLLSETDLPADLQRLDLTFNGEMKLIGARIERAQVRPGERVPLTVYWQALKPMTTNYSVFVHLIGRDQRNVGQLNSYPGMGLRPTTTLAPGQIVKDDYPVLVNGGSVAPTRLRVNVGLFDIKAPGRPGIPAIGPGGQELAPTVGQLKLVPPSWPPLNAGPPVAEFGDHIQLAEAHLDGCQDAAAACHITFTWAAQVTPVTDYTVFIQLWQADRMVAGFDGPPLRGDYPTSLWAADEVIIDAHPLDLSGLAPGDYRLLSGLYDFATGERLPASVDGRPLPDSAVEVGEISVRAGR